MKNTKSITKALDPPKPFLASAPAAEKKDQLRVSPFNISRERLMEGASKTTEVLTEILQRQSRIEPAHHWGINE